MTNIPDKEVISRLYKKMLLIREVEQLIADIYHTDAIKSPVHLSIGQESIAAGACDAMEDSDYVSNTYRCHATHIAKGADLNRMMAELYGKIGGCAKGKAGSMHLIEMDSGVLGASAVVGSTIPVAAGYSWALKQEDLNSKNKRAVVAFFGDGATEEGCFAESVNFAALKKLPIVFLCENNRLAIHSHIENRWATEKIRERIATYDVPTFHVEGGDVFEVRDATFKALEHARSGKGPAFIECETYRWKEHVGPADDFDQGYRDPKEFEKWKKNDQIARLEEILDDSEVESIKSEVQEMIKEAQKFAEESPYAEPEELFNNVYAT